MKSCRDYCHYLPLSEVTTFFVAKLDYVTYLYKPLVLLNQIQGSWQKKKIDATILVPMVTKISSCVTA